MANLEEMLNLRTLERFNNPDIDSFGNSNFIQCFDDQPHPIAFLIDILKKTPIYHALILFPEEVKEEMVVRSYSSTVRVEGVEGDVICFRIDQDTMVSLDVPTLRTILKIPSSSEPFYDPSAEDIQRMLGEMHYVSPTGNFIMQLCKNDLPNFWRYLSSVFIRSVLGRVGGVDKGSVRLWKLVYGIYTGRNVDYAAIIHKDIAELLWKQGENNPYVKSPRFWGLIIEHFCKELGRAYYGETFMDKRFTKKCQLAPQARFPHPVRIPEAMLNLADKSGPNYEAYLEYLISPPPPPDPPKNERKNSKRNADKPAQSPKAKNPRKNKEEAGPSNPKRRTKKKSGPNLVDEEIDIPPTRAEEERQTQIVPFRSSPSPQRSPSPQTPPSPLRSPSIQPSSSSTSSPSFRQRMIPQQSHSHEPANDDVFERVKFSDLVSQTLLGENTLLVVSDQESLSNSSVDEDRREPLSPPQKQPTSHTSPPKQPTPHTSPQKQPTPPTSPQPQPSTNTSPIQPSISLSYNGSTIRLSPGSPTDTFVIDSEPREASSIEDKIVQRLNNIKAELSQEVHAAESRINKNVQDLASTVAAQGKLLTTILEKIDLMVSRPATSIEDMLESFYLKQKEKEKEEQAKIDQAKFLANQSQMMSMYQDSIARQNCYMPHPPFVVNPFTRAIRWNLPNASQVHLQIQNDNWNLQHKIIGECFSKSSIAKVIDAQTSLREAQDKHADSSVIQKLKQEVIRLKLIARTARKDYLDDWKLINQEARNNDSLELVLARKHAIEEENERKKLQREKMFSMIKSCNQPEAPEPTSEESEKAARLEAQAEHQRLVTEAVTRQRANKNRLKERPLVISSDIDHLTQDLHEPPPLDKGKRVMDDQSGGNEEHASTPLFRVVPPKSPVRNVPILKARLGIPSYTGDFHIRARKSFAAPVNDDDIWDFPPAPDSNKFNIWVHLDLITCHQIVREFYHIVGKEPLLHSFKRLNQLRDIGKHMICGQPYFSFRAARGFSREFYFSEADFPDMNLQDLLHLLEKVRQFTGNNKSEVMERLRRFLMYSLSVFSQYDYELCIFIRRRRHESKLMIDNLDSYPYGTVFGHPRRGIIFNFQGSKAFFRVNQKHRFSQKILLELVEYAASFPNNSETERSDRVRLIDEIIWYIHFRKFLMLLKARLNLNETFDRLFEHERPPVGKPSANP